MKQIYNQISGFNELAYKEGVLVYKEAQILIDYQSFRTLYTRKVFAK